MGGAVRRQSGRPAADPQRAAQKNADRPVRITPRNGQSAGTAVAREVRAAVGSRFPAARMGRPDAAFLRDAHPFTSPNPEDIGLFDTDPGKIRANAYDFVVNGVEVGGGSIRIFDAELQAKMFETLGFTHEEAENQFGFLMNAFRFGAPPHGGIAFGFDRWCALFGGADSIRDYIAFPKNNAGRDVMLDAPGYIDQTQLDELYLQLRKPEE